MDKYVNKVKDATNKAVKELLSKRKTVDLINGSKLEINNIGEVTVLDFSELKLMDFIGGRKFEVSGTGKFEAWVNAEENHKYISFSLDATSLEYNDKSQLFEVTKLGKVTPGNFTK